jgi:hypothetical protein
MWKVTSKMPNSNDNDDKSLADLLTELADAIREKTGIADHLSIADMITAVKNMSASGVSITYAVVDDNNKLQKMDLNSANYPTASGDPISIPDNIYVYNTSLDEPKYSAEE